MIVARFLGEGMGRCFLGAFAFNAFVAAAALPALGAAASAHTGATNSLGSSVRSCETSNRWFK